MLVYPISTRVCGFKVGFDNQMAAAILQSCGQYFDLSLPSHLKLKLPTQFSLGIGFGLDAKQSFPVDFQELQIGK